MLSMLVVTTVCAMALLVHRRTSPARVVVALCAQAVALVLYFADAFQAVGLLGTGGMIRHPAYADSLYFSTVAWTTLGYGDLQPPPDYRLLASAEALIGYVYLGWIVGLATSLFSQTETA